jgi:nitroreductase
MNHPSHRPAAFSDVPQPSDLGMDVLEAIYQRRSVRDYTEQEVTPEVVEQLLEAATQAPSAANQQPWAFAVFHGKELLRELSERAKLHLLATVSPSFELLAPIHAYADLNYNIFHNASTLIVVYAHPGKSNAADDCCLAAENLMLAACGLGLATCPIGYARSWLDLPEVKEEFDIPSRYTAVFPLVLGYPARHDPAPPRREPEIACWQWT